MTKEEIKALIAEKIKPNGEGAITAGVLADVLNSIVDGVGSRVITYDQPITLYQTDAYRFSNNATDEELNFIYKAIFGHEFVPDTGVVAADLKGLKEGVAVKFTNLTIEGVQKEWTPFELVAEVSASNYEMCLYCRRYGYDYMFNLISR